MSLSGTPSIQQVSAGRAAVSLNSDPLGIDDLVREVNRLSEDLVRTRGRLIEAEATLFVHLARHGIPADHLAKYYQQARERGVHGWAKRWHGVGLPSPQQLRLAGRRIPPNGETSWTGPIPLDLGQEFPLGPVAFVIYENGLPTYVGSTMTLRNRIKRLVEPWQRGHWRAWPGKDRQDAYRIARELRTQGGQA